jgi:SNF2 family DNA or RNA helicase
VTSLRLIAPDTVEERVRALQENKSRELEALWEETAPADKITIDTLKDLLGA